MRTLYLVPLLLLCGCKFIPGTDSYKIQKAKEKVQYNLIDGDSAKFRELHVIAGMVCGQVNSKNRMGAYVGFVYFKVRDDSVEINNTDSDLPFEDCKDPIDRFIENNASKTP